MHNMIQNSGRICTCTEVDTAANGSKHPITPTVIPLIRYILPQQYLAMFVVHVRYLDDYAYHALHSMLACIAFNSNICLKR